jgi:hypothetical protein
VKKVQYTAKKVQGKDAIAITIYLIIEKQKTELVNCPLPIITNDKTATNISNLITCFPVNPWQITLVFLSIQTLAVDDMYRVPAAEVSLVTSSRDLLGASSGTNGTGASSRKRAGERKRPTRQHSKG